MQLNLDSLGYSLVSNFLGSLIVISGLIPILLPMWKMFRVVLTKGIENDYEYEWILFRILIVYRILCKRN